MREDAQRRFKLIVFDWDGTLSDSTIIIARAIQDACRDLGEPVPDLLSARFVIGLGLADAMRTVAPDLPVHRHSEMAAHYRRHYLAREENIPLFSGAAELLEELAVRWRYHQVEDGFGHAVVAYAEGAARTA